MHVRPKWDPPFASTAAGSRSAYSAGTRKSSSASTVAEKSLFLPAEPDQVGMQALWGSPHGLHLWAWLQKVLMQVLLHLRARPPGDSASTARSKLGCQDWQTLCALVRDSPPDWLAPAYLLNFMTQVHVSFLTLLFDVNCPSHFTDSFPIFHSFFNFDCEMPSKSARML